MTGPAQSFIPTSAGRFRALTWGRPGGEPVLFLHGLTAVADVWGPTVSHLGPGRNYVAVDQRGHGDSPHEGPYDVGRFVADTESILRTVGAPVHLVGHSMGARIGILMAARLPHLLRSVAIVDIGVEASRANIRETSEAIEGMPASFANEDEAFAFAFRRRAPDRMGKAIFRARLKAEAGVLVWRGSPEAMVAIVRSHRARNYWKEWKAINLPALYVRGSRSNEVSPRVYGKMRQSNTSVRYTEFEDVPHNIPLIAPERLAAELEAFWKQVAR